VSTDGLPDIYEVPRHQLDFVASHELNQQASIKFKMTNLLNEDAVYKIGDQVQRSKTRGQAVGIGLTINL
ncbi:MAG: hypothetical protein KDD40_01960, partial [Bdellovibrionales bacterium]|nr:hypothetical protein [Bdellovibrionales bacterium]